MSKRQRKPNQLCPYGNGKNVERNSWSRARGKIKDVSLSLDSGLLLFPTVITLCPIFSARAVCHCLVIWKGRSVASE